MLKKPTSHIVAVMAALCGAATIASAQNFDPIALTPGSFTQDIIVEATTPLPGGAPSYYGLNVTVGNGSGMGDNTYYEQGMHDRVGQSGGNSGVPIHNTVFTSINNANMTFRMPPDYTVENDLMINSSFTSGALAFTTPTTATNLAVLCTGGGGPVVVNYTVTHQDSSTETGTLNVFDWFDWQNSGLAVAWGCNGRITKDGGYNNYNSSSVNNNPPYLFGLQISVSGASPVTGISFTYSSGQNASFFGVSGNNTGTWTPIAVTGFNVKAIVPATFPLTATMDQGTNTAYNGNLATWFELGYADAAGYTQSGLPHAGTLLTNINHSTHIYQMPSSYAANNAILIDTNHQIANITPANPTNYSAFALLTAGGNVGGANTMTNEIIMQYADGTSETNLFYGYDWFANNSQVAYTTGGRVNMANRTLNSLAFPVTSSSNPKLFETTVGLGNPGVVVTNIVLKYKTAPSGNSTTYVLAVSATAGAVAPVIFSQPNFVNFYQGTGSNVSVTLSAGTAPLSYQWQKAEVDLSNGGSISGATTSNLVFTASPLSDSGSYRVIITNSAGAVTSAPIAVVVLSTNPDVTLPGDAVAAYQPSGGSSPANESAFRCIDNTTTKYLNFGVNNGATPFVGTVGFSVFPVQGKSTVTGVRLYAANDAPSRDPADYTLEGSDDGTNYTFIAAGSINLPTARNAAGATNSPLTQSLAEVNFSNPTSYARYRLYFSSVRDAANASSMQVGEVELLGTLNATAPFIYADVAPSNTLNYIGLSTALTVAGGGTPPLYYQWKANGSNIPDATNTSYSVTTLAGTNNYSCVVSNSTGLTATSSSATVVGVAVPASFVVNFHYAMAGQYAADTNEAALNMWTNVTYTGLGAYADAPANTNWNGFGVANGYSPVFDSSVVPQRYSDGGLTPVTFTATYNHHLDNVFFYGDGSPGSSCADCPSLVLNALAIATTGSPDGTFTLRNVPPGNYTLYLYGKSWQNDRDTKFTVNSGTPFNGVNICTNSAATNFATAFVLYDNYVYFQGVTPNPNGTITGTFSGVGVTNAVSGLTGEGSFNGLQLIKNPSNTLLSINKSGANIIVSWSPVVGQLQAATQLTGTFTNVVGATSPYTNSAATGATYYRVKVQ